VARTAATSIASTRYVIDTAVSRYARAIESRNVAAIRATYPGMTKDEESAWREFFASARNLSVALAVGRVDIANTTAEAMVSGNYTYKNTLTGRAEESPVSFRMLFVRDSGGWRLRALR
jgi:hypothetical protein